MKRFHSLTPPRHHEHTVFDAIGRIGLFLFLVACTVVWIVVLAVLP